LAGSAAGAFLGLSLLACLPGCFFIKAELDAFARGPKPLEERVLSGEGKDKILLMNVSRLISTEAEEDPFGIRERPSAVARVEEELTRASSDDSIRAVVVRINSPGGTVTASDIVYDQLMEFKKEKDVPVVAQLMDVAASGGYYVALAADDIVAYPTTVTGSIGVVFHGVSLEGLFDKIGIRDQTVKSGEKKDIGSPLRKMTAEERQLLQVILDEMKERFVGLVIERRLSLADDAEALIADGRIFSAEQARELGLVDRIGTLEDSIELAKQRAGITEARVVAYRRKNEHGGGIHARAGEVPPMVNVVNLDLGSVTRTPQFLYLWVPGSW
jgi:protease-4